MRSIADRNYQLQPYRIKENIMKIQKSFPTKKEARCFEDPFLNNRGLNKPGLDVCLYYPGSSIGNGQFVVQVIGKKHLIEKCL